MVNANMYGVVMRDPLFELPGYALRRASAAMMADYAAELMPLGLTFGEASVLMVIGANARITQSDVGRLLDIQRANMAPLVARLDARGLIARARVDGRSQGLALSSRGEALRIEVAHAIARHETRLLALIPPAHRDHLMPALTALWHGAVTSAK